jgi:hypothetical protein
MSIAGISAVGLQMRAIVMKFSATAAAASFAVVLAIASDAASGASPALNILIYGNSFMNNTNLPDTFVKVAVGAGQTQPSVVNSSVNSQDLGYHIAHSSAISQIPQSGKWNYVVMQEYSTTPTDIQGICNPNGFKANAQTLYGLVVANSPAVKPVLFETWARQPSNPDLHSWYSSQPVVGGAAPYMAASLKMQSELRQHYGEARALLGGTSVCRLASVGDAFQSLSFNSDLYQPDVWHESNKGSLLGALILYDTIYQDGVADVSYTSMDAALTARGGLANYGISDASQWTALATLADTTAAVPEPTALGLLGVGAMLLIKRRRAA